MRKSRLKSIFIHSAARRCDTSTMRGIGVLIYSVNEFSLSARTQLEAISQRLEEHRTYVPRGTAQGRSARSFAANTAILSLCCAVRSSSSHPFSSRVLRAGSIVNGTT